MNRLGNYLKSARKINSKCFEKIFLHDGQAVAAAANIPHTRESHMDWPAFPMKISQEQLQRVAHAMITQKLAGAMRRAVPGFGELSPVARAGFLEECLQGAAARGLQTEQGVASYALAAWFLEPGFEEKSRYLMALLDSAFPEVRKVYAMNEWVHVLLGDPANMAAADESLKQAFYRTAAWGSQPAGS